MLPLEVSGNRTETGGRKRATSILVSTGGHGKDRLHPEVVPDYRRSMRISTASRATILFRPSFVRRRIDSIQPWLMATPTTSWTMRSTVLSAA